MYNPPQGYPLIRAHFLARLCQCDEFSPPKHHQGYVNLTVKEKYVYLTLALLGDPLNIVYFLGCKIFHPNPAKIVLKTILSFYMAFSAVQTFYMISAPQEVDMVNYGALFLQMLWAMLGILVLLSKSDLIEDVMSSIDLWAIDSADEETETKILKESKFINMYVFLNTVVGLVWAITMTFPNHREVEHFFPVFLFQKWLPQHNHFLGYVFKITSFVTSFTMVAHGYQVIYATQHLKFQIYIFNKFVENICYGFIENEEKVVHDRTYQSEIEYRLKVLIKRHQDFFKWRNHTLSIMKHLIVPFSFGGCLIGMSVGFGFLQITKNSPLILFFRAAFFTILATSTFCSLIAAGQTLETESDNIYNRLMSTNWYQWKGNNRKILAVILCNSINPINLKFTDSFAINFRLGMAICKTVYTAVSVFYNVK
ncbi:hypothetical protein Zmor_016249 [Zophobas morio]|uniref:Odorant receptor n=1 Tax=Zophobas morio TaxID=2755281 RepID=A0AA38INP7_9CUCU|nr:hypothetical protein Zmor_016249 [Zophobas morio]